MSCVINVVLQLQERAAVRDWQASNQMRLQDQNQEAASEACQRYIDNANLLRQLFSRETGNTFGGEGQHTGACVHSLHARSMLVTCTTSSKYGGMQAVW